MAENTSLTEKVMLWTLLLEKYGKLARGQVGWPLAIEVGHCVSM